MHVDVALEPTYPTGGTEFDGAKQDKGGRRGHSEHREGFLSILGRFTHRAMWIVGGLHRTGQRKGAVATPAWEMG